MDSPSVTPPVSRLSAIGQLYVTTVGAVALLSLVADSAAWHVALVVLDPAAEPAGAVGRLLRRPRGRLRHRRAGRRAVLAGGGGVGGGLDDDRLAERAARAEGAARRVAGGAGPQVRGRRPRRLARLGESPPALGVRRPGVVREVPQRRLDPPRGEVGALLAQLRDRAERDRPDLALLPHDRVDAPTGRARRRRRPGRPRRPSHPTGGSQSVSSSGPASTFRPSSSSTSRATASCGDSLTSTTPPGRSKSRL